MIQVSRSIMLPADASAVWGVIGGFDALPEWHPAVQGSKREEVDGAVHRRLDLGGGAEIFECLIGAEDKSYSYTIVSPGPLPVAEYRATLTVAQAREGCVVVWTSTFEPTAAEADSAAAIAGVYEAGFGALADRFKD